MASLFELPNELALVTLSSQLPCRDAQLRALATLISFHAASTRNIVLHGLEATGKTAVARGILDALSSIGAGKDADGHVEQQNVLCYTIIKSAECITGRHLLEQTVSAVARAVGFEDLPGRCENLAMLAVEIGRILEVWAGKETKSRKRFVLVFDGIDRQRDAPPTLLPALARLGEIIPNLTTIFIVTKPRPHFLHMPGVPHIHFPSYTKAELLSILSLTTPKPLLPSGSTDTTEVWSRFTTAVYDSLSKHSGRDIISFRSVCLRLWPRFIRPILEGTHSATPFSRLLLANRSLLQNENILIPSLIFAPPLTKSQQSTLHSSTPFSQSQTLGKAITHLQTQLPYYSRLILLASYLCSYNPPRTDLTFFTKSAISKRKKRGGGTALSRTTKTGIGKSRKISRKLLGPQAFVLERMLAVFAALRDDAEDHKRKLRTKKMKLMGIAAGGVRDNKHDLTSWAIGEEETVSGSSDIHMAIATLASLRLLVRLGASADVLDGSCRFRVAVGWEAIRSLGRSVGIEVEEYLAE